MRLVSSFIAFSLSLTLKRSTSVVPPPASVISPFGAQPFMEDIQTQIGVDDLFRVERPAPPLPMVVVEPPVVPKSGRPYRKFSKGQPSRT